MDPVIFQVPKDLLGHMSSEELTELIRLLELARKPGSEPPMCDGKQTHQ
jgi:hypothetical protein